MSTSTNNYKSKDKNKYTHASHEALASMMQGKIPPMAKDLERQVIGLLFFNPQEYIFDARMVVKPEDFYVPGHQVIVRIIYQRHTKGEPIDLPLIVEELKRQGELENVGGLYYVMGLIDFVAHATNLTTYCQIIKQYALARKLMGFCVDVMAKVSSDDIFDSLEYVQERLYQLYEENKDTSVNDLTSIGFKTIQQTLEIKDDADWVETMFPEWDKINGQLMPGLYVVAGRPGMGKTAFVIELICRMAKKYPISLINGEMSDVQITRRCVSNLVRFPNHRFKIKPQDWEDEWKEHFHRGIQDFVNLKLHIYSDSQDIDSVCNMIRYYVRKFKCKVAIVDFFQIMNLPPELAKYFVGTEMWNLLLRRLRELAKELEISIVMLSQLNRELMKRTGSKRPNLADLKGSGTIEEYAYQISFLHRPEYYGDKEDEFGASAKGLCLQYIDKHRDGELGVIKHRFLPEYSAFEAWEDEYTANNWNPMKAHQNDTTPF